MNTDGIVKELYELIYKVDDFAERTTKRLALFIAIKLFEGPVRENCALKALTSLGASSGLMNRVLFNLAALHDRRSLHDDLGLGDDFKDMSEDPVTVAGK